ncbi:MAG: ParB N-terminal domain-containing protein [Endozoicomonas sp.]|uniref:ParB N-terminal domain-containing protein n=1 Tax=Endozoicomonas sp. TaxID=1892382 RepID=UPI003D9AD4A0
MSQIYEFIDLERLRLDHYNPRLPTSLHEKSEDIVINWMLTDASLVELMLAIGNNGFFPGEPLLIIKEDDDYIVVEGNRRLASLKLLQDPSIAETQKKKVKTVAEETTEKPTKIPCIIFNERSEVNKYLGYRHITGIKEWDLLSKARYLKTLSDDITSEEPKKMKSTLAKAIGSKPDYVNRLLIAYDLFLEIEKNSFFQIRSLNEETIHFNYLLDSLRRTNIRDFIGVDIKSNHPIEELTNNTDKKNNFKQLIHWFFDTAGRIKVAIRGDSESLTKLDAILADKIATQYLFRSEDLEESYEKLNKTYDSFNHNLSLAKKNITAALNQLPSIKEQHSIDIETASEIRETAQMIVLKLQAITPDQCEG